MFTDAWLIALIAAIISSSCAVALWIRRSDAKGPFTTIDIALAIGAAPFALVFLIASVIGIKNLFSRESDPEPGVVVDTHEGPSSSEHVDEVVGDIAERTETHIREDATDDEVAARGAALFDPSAEKPNSSEEA